jgi:hypothetical protein
VKAILKIINSDKITLAYLNNLESGIVRQVINGEYVISFVALIEELKTELLHDENNLIEYDNDYFKVIHIEEEHDSDNMLKVYIDCEHISYDLIQLPKASYTQTNRSAIYVMNDLLTDSGFNFIGTDVTTTASIDIQQETNTKNLLYQSAIIWQGELSYFQYDIELKQQLGQNRGADFRFGKNIQNIKRLIDRVENTVSYEVEVVQGTELEELGYFQLGDTIRVVDDMLNIEIDIRIIELEKDLVTGLNSSIVLGQPIKDLSTGFNNIFNSIKKTENKVNNVIDEHGNLIAEKLTGSLNTAITQIENSTSTVTFDDRGIITHDQPIEIESIKAILITSDGILIANAKNVDGTWKWRTAVTADGISADEINTGTLTAINISGVTITGSTLTSDNAKAQIKLDNGVLSLLDKASTAQFNINYRDGLPENVLQSELELYNEFKASNPSKPANNTMSLNSQNSHMGIELGNGAVSLGNDWVKMTMYGGTFDWLEAYPEYANWEALGYLPPPTSAQGAKLVIDLASSLWVWATGLAGLGSSSIDINLDNNCWVNMKASLDVRGDFEVHGTKDCVIETEEYGKLHFGAYEVPEYYFGDLGESEVIDGICTIELDERLLRCVNTDIPYQVFLQAYGDGRVYVAERNKTSFTVKGENIKFSWEVKAKRKNYENIRFGQPK